LNNKNTCIVFRVGDVAMELILFEKESFQNLEYTCSGKIVSGTRVSKLTLYLKRMVHRNQNTNSNHAMTDH